LHWWWRGWNCCWVWVWAASADESEAARFGSVAPTECDVSSRCFSGEDVFLSCWAPPGSGLRGVTMAWACALLDPEDTTGAFGPLDPDMPGAGRAAAA
jgi:hypothetical protein